MKAALRFIIFCLHLVVATATHTLRAQEVWDGTAAKWTQGDGSAAHPFLIESPRHLAYLQQTVTKGESYKGLYFRQTVDLNMGAKELGKEKGNFHPIGYYDKGVDLETQETVDDSKRFEGSYDGAQKCISNLYQYYDCEKQATIGGMGLFGCVGPHGEVINLTLAEDCSIEGNSYGASFASYMEGKLRNCHSRATVKGFQNIAGLVSSLLGGTIEHCSYVGALTGTMNVAGIASTCDVENNQGSTILNTYCRVAIENNGFYSAGFIGQVFGATQIANCYTAGSFTGDYTFAGGFIAGIDARVLRENKLQIAHSFYDKSTFATSIDAMDKEDLEGVEYASSEELKGEAILAQLGDAYEKDKDNSNEGYPLLRKTAVAGIQPIKEQAANLRYSYEGSTLTIFMESKDAMRLYDLKGRLLQSSHDGHFLSVDKGSYILETDAKAYKLVLR